MGAKGRQNRKYFFQMQIKQQLFFKANKIFGGITMGCHLSDKQNSKTPNNKQ